MEQRVPDIYFPFFLPLSCLRCHKHIISMEYKESVTFFTGIIILCNAILVVVHVISCIFSATTHTVCNHFLQQEIQGIYYFLFRQIHCDAILVVLHVNIYHFQLQYIGCVQLLFAVWNTKNLLFYVLVNIRIVMPYWWCACQELFFSASICRMCAITFSSTEYKEPIIFRSGKYIVMPYQWLCMSSTISFQLHHTDCLQLHFLQYGIHVQGIYYFVFWEIYCVMPHWWLCMSITIFFRYNTQDVPNYFQQYVMHVQGIFYFLFWKL